MHVGTICTLGRVELNYAYVHKQKWHSVIYRVCKNIFILRLSNCVMSLFFKTHVLEIGQLIIFKDNIIVYGDKSVYKGLTRILIIDHRVTHTLVRIRIHTFTYWMNLNKTGQNSNLYFGLEYWVYLFQIRTKTQIQLVNT